MMDTFQVHILAADRTFYEGPCVSLTVPTNDGERGILAHHSSMIAAIQPGTLRYQVDEDCGTMNKSQQESLFREALL